MNMEKPMITVERTNKMDPRFKELYEFCRKATKLTDNPSLQNNMDYITWEENNSSLLYKTFKKRVFDKDNGEMDFIYEDGELISIAGIERFRYDLKNVALIGSRYYILRKPKGVTNFFHDYIWPEQISWCKENKIKLGIMRFNSYNERLFTIFQRILKKKGTILGRKNPNLYQDIKLVAYPKKLLIEFTPQNVVLCYFDKNFNWKIPEEIKIGEIND